MSLRVCHVLRPAEGGMLSQVRSLLDEESLLAAPPAVLAKLTTPSAPYPLSPSGSLKAQWHAAHCLARWVRGRADVLHGHGLARAPLFAIAAKASGLPLVVTLHNLVPKLSLSERLAARAALSVAKKIICVSQAVSESAAGIVPKHNRVIVYNGVLLNKEKGRDDSTEGHVVFTEGHANKTKGHDDGAEGIQDSIEGHKNENILCVARLSQEKGIDIFLEAARKIPEARFIVAGDGPERAVLERIAGPNIEFLGFVDDIPALLSRAAVLAVPSREEGLGLSALEAMAAGVPVVASAVGGLKEVVSHNETGLLVAPEDPAALAEAIKELLTDPARRKEMGRAAQIRVAEKFSVEAMRKKARAVWEEALR